MTLYCKNALELLGNTVKILYIEYDMDKDATITKVEGTCCRELLGYTNKELTGIKAFDLIVKEDIKNFARFYQKKNMLDKK